MPEPTTSDTYTAEDVEVEVQRRLAEAEEKRRNHDRDQRLAKVEEQIKVLAKGFEQLSRAVERLSAKRLVAYATGGGAGVTGIIQGLIAAFGG